jgi:hypothetical protein
MKKQTRHRKEKSPRFISGIYNYCDRWCERCGFTAQCRNFTAVEKHFPDQASRDINNRVFWQAMHKTFQDTIKLIRKVAKKQGIDLDTIDYASTEDDLRRNREATERHPCVRTARQYIAMADKMLEAMSGCFREKEDELKMRARLEMHATDPRGEAVRLGDALEVIRWHQHQICVKLQRAASGAQKDPLEYCIDDSNGSAKVALIGIDRSIAAWANLRQAFPEHGDGLLDILVHLERLRRDAEKAFPGARSFVRPGFDQPNGCPNIYTR